jgi:hypothetical protein
MDGWRVGRKERSRSRSPVRESRERRGSPGRETSKSPICERRDSPERKESKRSASPIMRAESPLRGDRSDAGSDMIMDDD